MNDRAHILSRIQKLMAMAEHERSNATEAATALRMAQALMAKFGVSEATLLAAKVEESQTPAATQTRTPWEGTLAATIASAFGIRVFWVAGKENPDWGFADVGRWAYYGDPCRVEVAGHCHTVLRRILQKAREEFVTDLPNHLSRSAKLAKAESFVAGFLETVKATCQPLVPSPSEQTALAAFRAERGLVRSTVRGLRDGDALGLASGREAGKGVSLHTPMRSGPERLRIA